MGGDQKIPDIDILEQLDEALEEREGTDRRKNNLGTDAEGKDRRKGDRRQPDLQTKNQ